MTELELWLKTGADVHEGLRLLSVYKPNLYLAKMVESYPDKYRDLLIRTLSGITREAVAATAGRTVKMRDEWPFLSEESCPFGGSKKLRIFLLSKSENLLRICLL